MALIDDAVTELAAMEKVNPVGGSTFETRLKLLHIKALLALAQATDANA
jgi:hypothetical protein